MNQATRLTRNYTVERDGKGGRPNYKLVSAKGNVVARFNWLNVGGIRVSTGDSMELSPSTVEAVNTHSDGSKLHDTDTTYAAGIRVTDE